MSIPSWSKPSRWGPHFACLVHVLLMLSATAAIGLVLHELGHAIAARTVAVRFRGIDVSLLPFSGTTYYIYPFVEAPHSAGAICATGGALAQAALSILALTVWRVSGRVRRSPLVPCLVLTNLGVVFVRLLGLGGTGDRTIFSDIAVAGLQAGLSFRSVRWITAMVGLGGAAWIGWWYCRCMLRWSCAYLPCSTAGQRRRALLSAAWAPLLPIGLYWMTGSISIRLAKEAAEYTKPLGGLLLFSLALPGLSLAATWIVASFPCPSGTPTRLAEPRALPWTSIIGAAVLLVGTGGVVYWADWRLDPNREPTPERISRWVERRPDAEKALRYAGYWSMQLRRVDDALAYYRRAVKIAPESAGALHDLAAGYHVVARHEQALELLKQAADLRPDLRAIPAKMAQVEEALGSYEGAAHAWRRYAEVVEAREPNPDSRDRHIRMAMGRARRLEEMAREAPAEKVED